MNQQVVFLVNFARVTGTILGAVTGLVRNSLREQRDKSVEFIYGLSIVFNISG